MDTVERIVRDAVQVWYRIAGNDDLITDRDTRLPSTRIDA